MDDIDADVIVVGAGPVGLATALGLSRAGVSTIVLERGADLNRSPRAMAYLHPVLPGLDDLGVLPDLEAKGLRGNGITFIDARTGEKIHQSINVLQGFYSHPYAFALGQGDVGDILLQHLAAFPHADVLWSHPVAGIAQDARGVTIRAESPEGPKTLRGRWLVGADGAASAVRQLLDIGFPGFTWGDRFVATNIVYDFRAHGLDPANWRMDKELGAVIAQIDGYSDLWRLTFRESDSIPLDGLEDRIHEHFKRALYGGDYELAQYAPYRMHQRCVDDFRHGRVILAGDAAHITNPIGGMGLTGGFLDAFVLYEALAAVVKNLVDDSILDLYAERRRRVWQEFVSPRASQLKRMMYDPPEGEAREEMLAALRLVANDDDVRRADLLGQLEMATPSLLPRM